MKRNVNIVSNIDWFSVFLYFLLVIMGWLNIYAAVYNEEHSSIFDFSQRYGKQMIWIFAAFVLAIMMLVIDMNFFPYFTNVLYLGVIFLLLLVLVAGKNVNGARSWFALGSLHIQPSEFAKFTTAMVIAKYLSNKQVHLDKFRYIFRILVLVSIPPLLILAQPDTGTALVFAAFILVMYREGMPVWIILVVSLFPVLFIVTLAASSLNLLLILVLLSFVGFWFIYQKIRMMFWGLLIAFLVAIMIYGVHKLLLPDYSLFFMYIAASVVLSLIFIIVSIRKKIAGIFVSIIFYFIMLGFTQSVNYAFKHFLKEHQQKRLNILLGIESDPLGVGYNVNQSKIAIGSGGFVGKGFLKGTQTKFNFVPEQSTDFIFCTVGEEWGFLGSLFVILIFLSLLLRMLFLCERQRMPFARIYGYGIVSILFFHFVVNISMAIGLFPVIGIPLPFFSYGGSSLWAFTIMLFVFLNFDSRRMAILG